MDYIGVILIEKKLAECVDYATPSKVAHVMREYGLASEQVNDDAKPDLVAHHLIALAIRTHSMTSLIKAMSNCNCVLLQIESWLQWAEGFDAITARLDLGSVLERLWQEKPSAVRGKADTRTITDLGDTLGNWGEEVYLICFCLAAAFGPDFEFGSLVGEDEAAKTRTLIAKCASECKLSALLIAAEELGKAGEMPYLVGLATEWLLWAQNEDRKCAG